MLRTKQSMHMTNYYYLDMILDFLIEQGIRPIISLDDKRRIIIRDILKSGYDEMEEKGLFVSFEEFLSVLEDFMKHAVHRYGKDEVSEWIFDLWYLSLGGSVMGIPADYVDVFLKVKRLIRTYAPGAETGGWGISSVEGKEEPLVTSLFQKWNESEREFPQKR